MVQFCTATQFLHTLFLSFFPPHLEPKLHSGSRWKRFADPDVDAFDVEGIEQLYHLLDTTVGTRTEV